MQFETTTILFNKIDDAFFHPIEEEDDWSASIKDLVNYSLDDIPTATQDQAEESRHWAELTKAFARMDFEDPMRRSVEEADIMCAEECEEDMSVIQWLQEEDDDNNNVFINKHTGRAVMVLEGVVNLPSKDRMMHLLRDHSRERVFNEPSFLVDDCEEFISYEPVRGDDEEIIPYE